MRFSERLRLAYIVFTGRGVKSMATLRESWKEGQPVYSDVSFENMARYGWRRNELIFACINKTANTASQVQLQILDRNGEEVADHPLKALIQKPNKRMSEFDFWSSVIIFLKLAGRAVYEKQRDRAGRVIALWPLRPDWINPIPDQKYFVSLYEYKVPGLAEPLYIKADDLVEFSLFDPLNLYGGWPPAAVAARVGDVDNALTDYIKLFFDKGGLPPLVLKTKQRIVDEAIAERIRSKWQETYGGFLAWGKPALLDEDASIEKLGFSFAEMGLDVLDGRDEARICMVMDIPPILVGAKIGLDRATYANYKEARTAWWTDSIVPVYASLIDVIQNQLASEFEGDFTIQFDLSQVPALQEDATARWQRATEALKSGGITVNEFCEQVGLPDKGPAGEVYLRSMAIVVTPAKGLPPPVPDEEPKHWQGKAAAASDEATRRKHERIIQKAVQGFLDDQLGRIEKDAVSRNGH